MARTTDVQIHIEGRLVAETPLHVGGVDGGNPDSDMPLAIDGQGRFYVPGTTLAGALRHWHATVVQDNSINRRMWGFQGRGDPQETESHASQIIVEDGIVEGNAVPEIRDGVGIDRVSGAAGNAIKYSTAILPKGALVRLKVTIDADRDHKEEAERFARELVRSLAEFGIRLGARRTSGMGHLKLYLLQEIEGTASTQERIDLTVREATLCTREGLLAHLRGQDPPMNLNLTSGRQHMQEQSVCIQVTWHPEQPLMVRSGTDGVAVDALPLVSRDSPDTVTMVIPGSSIKGSLRSRAEQIMRTIEKRAPQRIGAQEFADQIEVHRLVDLLFGYRRHNEEKDKARGMGLLAVDDCYAKTQIARSTWDNVRSASTDPELATALGGTLGEPKLQHVHHVAIDRWTGGAADQRLFSQLEPQGVDWSPMSLSLDFSRIEEVEQKTSLMLLLLILRDLAAGRLQLGCGTNRGMGGVVVTKIAMTPAADVTWMSGRLDLRVVEGKLIGFPEGLAKDLQKEWSGAVTSTGGLS